MKFGLHGIRTLLKNLDAPEKRFPSIHIAGTNGKGSTASMIAAMYTAAGYRTGLYTSPHLINFNERIRINGEPIPISAVARLTTLLESAIRKNRSTFFEAVTALAFTYFAESGVDLAVVETGLGGRLDATNVLRPLVSVITSIGLEHTEILGSTVERIAFEKGGIVKAGVPCISGVRDPKAQKVLKAICRKRHSGFISVPPSSATVRKSALAGVTADLHGRGWNLKSARIALAGRHQAANAAVAVAAAEAAAERSGMIVNDTHLRAGLKKVIRLTGLQARLTVIQRNPLLIADVAHNPEAIATLCDSLTEIHRGKFAVVFGLMGDKDHRGIISRLKDISEEAYVVQARTERAMAAETLATEFGRWNVRTHVYHSVARGLAAARRRSPALPVLVVGSHFVVGEALAILGKRKYLTISQ